MTDLDATFEKWWSDEQWDSSMKHDFATMMADKIWQVSRHRALEEAAKVADQEYECKCTCLDFHTGGKCSGCRKNEAVQKIVARIRAPAGPANGGGERADEEAEDSDPGCVLAAYAARSIGSQTL